MLNIFLAINAGTNIFYLSFTKVKYLSTEVDMQGFVIRLGWNSIWVSIIISFTVRQKFGHILIFTHFQEESSMTKTACKLCHVQLPYCGDMNSMSAHLVRYHLEPSALECPDKWNSIQCFSYHFPSMFLPSYTSKIPNIWLVYSECTKLILHTIFPL